MSQVKNKAVIFSAEELKMAEELKGNITKDLRGELEDVKVDISTEISLDHEGNVRWGHVYVSADADEGVWRIIDKTKDNYAHSHGFPDILIDVLPA